MAWVETEAHGFVARHESEDPESAAKILETMADVRPRVEGVLGRTREEEPTVVIHGSEWALNLAEPVLPVLRAFTAPAGRRYLAGWIGAGEIHVLSPKLL